MVGSDFETLQKNLNALSREMLATLHAHFLEAEADAQTVGVFLDSTSEKAFCAGGDVRGLYDILKAGTPAMAEKGICDFFTTEYALDSYLYTFPKPIAVWAQGIAMGGGLGLMMGASHRIATETTLMAMPEISIGLYPDVGATWFLNRLPESTARFLAMTGCRLRGQDLLEVHWANALLQSTSKPAFLQILANTDWSTDGESNKKMLSSAIQKLPVVKAATAELQTSKAWIEKVFHSPRANEIWQKLQTETPPNEFLKAAIHTLKTGCPASILLANAQIKLGKLLSREKAFELELDLSCKMVMRPDFFEGVRALLVDKDKKPAWRPVEPTDSLISEMERLFSASKALTL